MSLPGGNVSFLIVFSVRFPVGVDELEVLLCFT